MAHKHLGELLIEENFLDEPTLLKAVEQQKKTGDKLGRILIAMGVITEEQLLKVLANQRGVPFVDLTYYDLDPALITLLPEIYARQYQVIVLARQDGAFLVGMADPLDINAVDAITKLLKHPVKSALVSDRILAIIHNRIYRRTHEISHFAKELSSEIGMDLATATDALFDESAEEAEQAPVVKLLNSLFRDAVQAGASDIHIEPDQKTLRIRFRVDGVLNEYILDDKRIAGALIQRLKLRANLDISEHRLPLDGGFNFKFKGHSFDVRVSTLPTANGESVVMRLLEQSAVITDLSQLGIEKNLVERIETIYQKPFGMLLVTGPTGSGKTTTLYSILSRLNAAERKIITVEDPVEYRISRINQVQVNTKIDLSFARVLRAILRQDPDVIMIGEIRDAETARIAMRAAVTGHFVLATLHTNDALSSALRLIDMGAEGYMVAAAVKAIIGQRLIRNLCKACIHDYQPDASEKAWLASMGVNTQRPFKNGVGCSHCGFRGYMGRTGIYELLELDSNMIDALRLNNASQFAKAAIACETYQPLAQSVLTLVEKGITSISEALRVVGQLDEEFKSRGIQQFSGQLREEEKE